MTAIVNISRAGPLVTVQDWGRPGHLGDGISASGPMDRMAFAQAGMLAGTGATSGLEITMAGIAFSFEGEGATLGVSGGKFTLRINGTLVPWDAAYELQDRDAVDITPGAWGTYGYLRFDADIDVPPVLGSRATNTIVGLGGLSGRTLKAGDMLRLGKRNTADTPAVAAVAHDLATPIRFTWGLHADNFNPQIVSGFPGASFRVTPKLNRMGARLSDPEALFADARILSLVSDPIVPGDIQILGDGTAIVLMRDHQPTGGYPRIGTVISADLDRFAQMRPGTELNFAPVTVAHAQSLLPKTGAVA